MIYTSESLSLKLLCTLALQINWRYVFPCLSLIWLYSMNITVTLAALPEKTAERASTGCKVP